MPPKTEFRLSHTPQANRLELVDGASKMPPEVLLTLELHDAANLLVSGLLTLSQYWGSYVVSAQQFPALYEQLKRMADD
jgi:hypothetical protein